MVMIHVQGLAQRFRHPGLADVEIVPLRLNVQRRAAQVDRDLAEKIVGAEPVEVPHRDLKRPGAQLRPSM